MTGAIHHDLVDIACEVRRDDPAKPSIAIADGSREEVNGREREKWFWLPRAEITINDDDTVTMPEWLARDRGLI